MAAANPRWAKGYHNRPRLNEPLTWLLEAFFDLTSDRYEAQAAIPFVAIEAYAIRYRLEGESFDRFKALIRAMDGAYLKHVDRKMREAAETAKLKSERQ